jgi:hypothetical protein
MNYASERDEEFFNGRATRTDAVRQWAWVVGADRPLSEWICSDYDSWELNPHYVGPKSNTHPEFDEDPGFMVFERWTDASAYAALAAQRLDHDVRLEHYNGACWVVWY